MSLGPCWQSNNTMQMRSTQTWRTPSMQARVTAAPRLRKLISSPPLARKDSDAPPRYLIVTSASDKEIGRVQIKVWLKPLPETDAHVDLVTVHARHRQSQYSTGTQASTASAVDFPGSWALPTTSCVHYLPAATGCRSWRRWRQRNQQNH